MTSTTEVSREPRPVAKVRLGDRIFEGLSTGSGLFLLLIMAAIALFLLVEAVPALRANTVNFFTFLDWNPNATPPQFGIAALVWGTFVTAVIALALAVPIAIGIALFISHYAPRRLAAVLGAIVDLLAAVPSVIYGLWGVAFLAPLMTDLHLWLNGNLGWIPLFGGDVSPSARSLLTAGVILAIMILPIIAAVSREVFLQVPRAHEEAALALGATRWEMIRTAVLPFGRPGVISAAMLGLGRAMGEVIAVALVLAPAFVVSPHILESAGVTLAGNIALKFNEAGSGTGSGALIASGLVLFVITLLVNMAARAVVARRKEFAGASG